jgi:hypothetical protein
MATTLLAALLASMQWHGFCWRKGANRRAIQEEKSE